MFTFSKLEVYQTICLHMFAKSEREIMGIGERRVIVINYHMTIEMSIIKGKKKRN